MTPLQTYGGTLSSDFLEAQRRNGIDDRDTATQMAQSSETFRNHFTRIQEATKGDRKAITAYLNMRFYGDAQYQPESENPKGYVGRTLDRMYKDFVTDTNESLARRESGEQGALQTVAEIAPNIASGILSPVTEGVGTVAGKVLEATGLDQKLAGAVSDLMNSGVGQDVIVPAIQKYQQQREQNPALRSLENIAELGGDIADVLGLGALVKSGPVRAATKGIMHPIDTLKATPEALGTGVRKTLGAIAEPVKGFGRGVAGKTDEVVELSSKAQEAIRTGVDEKVVRFIEERTPTEKALMKDIYLSAKEGAEKLGGTNKHKKIAGEQIIQSAEHIIRERKHVGQALGNIKKAMADEVVDLTDESTKIIQQMRNRGVLIDEKFVVKGVTSGSDAEIPVLQKIVNGIRPDKDGLVIKTFGEADDYRSKIFAEINAAKAKLSPTSQGQSALSMSDRLGEVARSNVLKKLGTYNRNYERLSATYAQLINEPADFFRLLGYKGDLEKISTESLRAGEVYLRVLGNASSRPEDALRKMTELARKHGFDSDVDSMALLQFADAVEDIFPSAPSRSLRGEVNRGAKDAGEELIKNKSAIRTALSLGDEKAMAFYQKLRKMTLEDRDRVLLELLDEDLTPFSE